MTLYTEPFKRLLEWCQSNNADLHITFPHNHGTRTRIQFPPDVKMCFNMGNDIYTKAIETGFACDISFDHLLKDAKQRAMKYPRKKS